MYSFFYTTFLGPYVPDFGSKMIEIAKDKIDLNVGLTDKRIGKGWGEGIGSLRMRLFGKATFPALVRGR